jgi:hypothetical protein
LGGFSKTRILERSGEVFAGLSLRLSQQTLRRRECAVGPNITMIIH